MEHIIPMLADPARYGGDPADAFDVIVPSLPGYGFSTAPPQRGYGAAKVADLWAGLMQRLGYDRFGAQGGYIGAGVSTWLARRYPEAIIGYHLNYISAAYRPPLGEAALPLTAEEQAFLDTSAAWAGARVDMHTCTQPNSRPSPTV